MGLKEALLNLPEVAAPEEKKLGFSTKLKWTGITLILFFILGVIDVFGLGANALAQFRFLSLILASEFGSVISLGIGPIVTASILLQLLNGSGIMKFDTASQSGRRLFQASQKGLAIAFVVVEAFLFVFTGAFAPAAGVSPFMIIFQLILGGLLIILLDEVVSKWGFGSGVSLFIAAGVSKEVMVRLLSPLGVTSGELAYAQGEAPIGALLAIFFWVSQGDMAEVAVNILSIIATFFVFAIAVYAQAMRVEVPLSFGRIRGQGIRWPLSFLYTSNMPVILTAALLANLQLMARILEGRGITFLGSLDTGSGASGLIAWFAAVDVLGGAVRGILTPIDLAHALTYSLFLIGGSVMFSIFWAKTAGMDARSQAKNMMNYGLQIPGFRRDERVLESLLNRYIPALTIMGAITVGFLAALADLSGALTSGTGLLLTVMIIYKLYEEIAQQHAMDMNPMLRRFMEK